MADFLASLNNSTDLPSTSDPCQPTLSGGSAAFIIIALILGTLAQPSGSLILSPDIGSIRLWRLSPLLCGFEGLTILISCLQARWKNIPQRERSFHILARRTAAPDIEIESLTAHLGRPMLELILPMMLQILKVIFIRGSWVTTAMAVMIWSDWGAVQYCHILIWIYSDEEETVWRPLQGQYQTGSSSVPSLGRGVDFLDDRSQRTVRFLGPAMVVISNFVQLGWATWKIWEYGESQHWYYRLPLRLTTGFIVCVCFVIFVCIADPTRLHWKAEGTSLISFCSFAWILWYYKFLYSDINTYKPQWLDWLG